MLYLGVLLVIVVLCAVGWFAGWHEGWNSGEQSGRTFWEDAKRCPVCGEPVAITCSADCGKVS